MSESFGEAMQRIQALPGTSAEEMERLSRSLLELSSGEHTTREIEPGIYEHTFTPTAVNWIDEQAPFTLADFDRVVDRMRNVHARSDPEMLYMSVETARSIRHFSHLGQMYRAHPIPRRKIRKCHMRKVHAAWRKGRAHIRRVEQAEQAREEAAMQRLRGNK